MQQVRRGITPAAAAGGTAMGHADGGASRSFPGDAAPVTDGRGFHQHHGAAHRAGPDNRRGGRRGPDETKALLVLHRQGRADLVGSWRKIHYAVGGIYRVDRVLQGDGVVGASITRGAISRLDIEPAGKRSREIFGGQGRYAKTPQNQRGKRKTNSRKKF